MRAGPKGRQGVSAERPGRRRPRSPGSPSPAMSPRPEGPRHLAGRPVLVVVGGADGMSPEDMTALAGAVGPVIRRSGTGGPRSSTAAPTPVSCGSSGRPMTRPERASRWSGWPPKAPSSSPGRARRRTLAPSTRTIARSSWCPGTPGATNHRGCPGWPPPSPGAGRQLTLVVNGGEIAYADIEHSLRGQAACHRPGGHRPDRGRHRGRRVRPGRGPEGRADRGLPGHPGRIRRRPRACSARRSSRCWLRPVRQKPAQLGWAALRRICQPSAGPFCGSPSWIWDVSWPH